MSVVIFTEGGQKTGFGHIVRCVSLCHAFEEKNILPTIIINGDKTIEKFLEDRRFIGYNWLKNRTKFIELITKFDVVIIDSYKAEAFFYEIVSKLVKTPVYIDDVLRLKYPKGIVINGALNAETLPYQNDAKITYLLGSKYAPLRKEFWDVPEKRIKEKVVNILVTLGGQDTKNLTPRILKLLIEHYPFLIKKVVVGSGFDNKEELEAIRNINVEFFKSPGARTMKELMLESDIAISAGGQTLYELARVGVPTIALAIADNQRNNIKGWQEAGFIKYAGWWNEKKISENILACIKSLINISVRLNMNKTGRKFVDGKGSIRIANTIMN